MIHSGETILIEASAGTGKTYTLLQIFLSFIHSKRSPTPLAIDSILILTYTEKSTQELKERIYQALLDAYHGALKSKDEKEIIYYSGILKKSHRLSIFTIHGFCQSLLTRYPLEFEVSPSHRDVVDEETKRNWTRLVIGKCSKILPLKTFILLKEHFPTEDDWCKAIEEALALGWQESSSPNHPLIIYPVLEGYSIEELEENLEDKEKSYLKHLHRFAQNLDKDEIRNLLKESKDLPRLHGSSLNSLESKCTHLKEIFTVPSEKKLFSEKINEWFHALSQDPKLPSYLSNLSKLFEIQKQERETHEKAKGLLINEAFAKLLKEAKSYHQAQEDEEKLLSYEQMIFRVHEKITHPQNHSLRKLIRQQYKVTLIDEFQDTDPWQWDIFKTLFHHQKEQTLVLVGDPKQSIYRFRNADYEIFYQAKSQASQVQTLDTNYRSSTTLIEGLNHLFLKGELFKNNSLMTYEAVQSSNMTTIESLTKNNIPHPPISWIQVQEEAIDKAKKSLFHSIQSWIESFTEKNSPYQLQSQKMSRSISYQDIAIITRTNKDAQEVVTLLQQENIPAQLASDELQNYREIDWIIYILLSLNSPWDKNHLLLLSQTPLFLQYMERGKLDTETLQKKIWEWHHLYETHNIEDALLKIFSEIQAYAFLKSYDPQEELSQYFFHLIQFLKNEHEKTPSLNKLAQKLRQSKLPIPSTKVGTSTQSVQVMTIHKSKGLEFPILFLFDLKAKKESKKQNLCRVHENKKYSIYLLPNQEIKQLEKKEDEKEEDRLFYVALTRGASALILPYTDSPKLTSLISRLDYPQNSWEKLKGSLETKESKNYFHWEVPKSKSENKISPKTPAIDIHYSPPKDIGDRKVKVESFTGLEKQLSRFHEETSVNEDNYNSQSIILPPGKEAGNLLHSILEQIPFQNFKNPNDSNALDKLIQKTLQSSSLSSHSYLQTWLKKMIENLLSTPLSTAKQQNFKLTDIEEYQPEMEFLLKTQPNSNISFSPNQMTRWNFQSQGDFIHGFIDMVFQYKEQFFIIDWKSNHLGITKEDYSYSFLEEAMNHHHYSLQYYIYIIALVKHLKHSHPSLSYHQFGGIYYLFLRGFSFEDRHQEGVYFQRPSKEEINTFSKQLTGANIFNRD